MKVCRVSVCPRGDEVLPSCSIPMSWLFDECVYHVLFVAGRSGWTIVSHARIIAVMESERGPSMMVMEGMAPLRSHVCSVEKGSTRGHSSEIEGRSGAGKSVTDPVVKACLSGQ